ncbi:MAG TPA: DUF2851 family protein [Bacteroidia bacterium]|jgi:hypothetical protein
MNEEFLHHAWKYGLFRRTALRTIAGEPVEIIQPGRHNFDSGPDFFNAQLKIGDQLWAGNVEIHIRSSDWNRHFHSQDAAYDNVVLHVVHTHDEKIKRRSGEEIPTLELGNILNRDAWMKYVNLGNSRDRVPCEGQLREVEEFTVRNWLDRLLIERLEAKSVAIHARLAANRNDLEESFYQLLARNFGFKVNDHPFELLARSLPPGIIAKHRDKPFQVEALLFGQAGLLGNKFREKYPRELKKEYEFLRKKYSLEPMPALLWKFMRMRPVNFPGIRIAQFARLMSRQAKLFSEVMEAKSAKELCALLACRPHEYWSDHYTFGVRSQRKEKQLGADAMNNIIINTIVPFLFVFGKQRGEERYVERAISFLETLDGEDNSIIRQWRALGMPAQTAGRTQALLHLKKEYCDKKKCLQCAIGAKLLSRKEMPMKRQPPGKTKKPFREEGLDTF